LNLGKNMIRGSTDALTTRSASGWIYTDTQKEPLTVEAVINHQVVGRAIASLPRPDLAAAGFGTGNCGFELKFNTEIDPLYLPFVRIQLAGTDLELPRWAGAGFGEYFRALHERYPRAGRAASVYGGLWTDRSDAAALLKGRAEIGMVTQRDANSVARFIHDGSLVVTRRDEKIAAVANATASDLPTAVAEAVFDEDLLRLLRTILDDHPVIIRADVLEANEPGFTQTSALEDLPSPAECVGLVFPSASQSTTVAVVRGGHRLPEFLSNGLSRWRHEASEAVSQSLTSDMPVDQHKIPRGTVFVIGPGTLTRVLAASGRAIRVLILPSRLSLLRFHKKPPRGELAHASGARIWV
jgi:hypothetical protein